MRVVISAGGTGGHIYPALAIINKIKQKEPNSQFLYIGTHNRMEKDLIPSLGIPFEMIEIYGFHRKPLAKNIKTVKCVIKGIRQCKKMIKEFHPDIVIGVGGYVTVPVIYAANKLGYKTVIHEQNCLPGKANRFLSRYVDRIFVSFSSTVDHFPKGKALFTGNPCSEEAMQASPISKRQLGLDPYKPFILFVMGSLGSSKMNDFLMKTMSLFQKKDYEILFVTGKDYYTSVDQTKMSKNIHVVPYIDKLTGVMKVCDLMVSRAGASTLSEIVALLVPSILIPSPYVANNEQYYNALDLKEKEAAILIEEKDLKEKEFVQMIDSIINDSNKKKRIKENLKKEQIQNSATLLVSEIQTLIGGQK